MVTGHPLRESQGEPGERPLVPHPGAPSRAYTGHLLRFVRSLKFSYEDSSITCRRCMHTRDDGLVRASCFGLQALLPVPGCNCNRSQCREVQVIATKESRRWRVGSTSTV